MRHRRLKRKLGVVSEHRKALLKNLVKNLIRHKRIETTYHKAKEASAYADRMVTLAKKGDLHARRLLIARLGCPKAAGILIKQIAPKFESRNGGYTRVLRLGFRPGDGAEMALLEFTEIFEAPKKEKKVKKKKSEEPQEKVKEKPAVAVKEETVEEKPAAKKEAAKKGGFLGTLRKFLKGEER